MEKRLWNEAKATCASSLTSGTDDNNFNCDKCLARVRKLQIRIVKALENKRYNKAKVLQHLLDNSLALNCIKHKTEPV
jgi:RNA-directed DNA polymerase